MRFSNLNGTYPCPVLRHASTESEYVSGDFTFDLEIQTDCSPNKLKITHEVIHPDISHLIATGQAGVAIAMHCEATYFYELVDIANKKTQVITLDEKAVFGPVYFSLVVKSSRAIQGFSPSGLDAAFAGLSFDVGPGDVLAISEEFQHVYGLPPLRVGDAIFTLVLQPELTNDEFTVNLGSDKIEIGVGEQLNTLIQHNMNTSDGRLRNISSIYFPGLVDVLYQIRTDDQEGKAWFESLRSAMQALGADIGSDSWEPLDMAQQLLRTPYVQLLGKGA